MKDAYRAANGVLHNAVAGIAEVINGDGEINVDFADVRTVMSENGMAMMGSAVASGEGRARIAAEQAVNSPFLENVNLEGARGVLVNISSSSDSFTLDEYYEVMNTIKSFTAEDASVFVGNVFDESLGENLRITLVATGLAGGTVRRQQKPELKVMPPLMTGTNNQPVFYGSTNTEESVPAAFSSNRRAQVEAMKSTGMDEFDIPAFLRKQAD